MGIIHPSNLLPNVKIFRIISLSITQRQSKFLTLTLQNTYTQFQINKTVPFLWQEI